MKRTRNSLAYLLATAGGLAWHVPADAQAVADTTATSSPGRLEEIMVTAQRRGENLQNVPIAVNAISADQLKTMGGTSSEDLNLIPGILYNPGPGGGQISIRGISGTNSGSDEPGNAIYIDGVYQFAASAALFQFDGIERIEVLKGPQGTLFGRNTAGGVVNVITRDPGRDFAAEGEVGYANYDTVNGKLYLSTPLSETLAANVSAYGFEQKDGWGRNNFTGDDVHEGYSWGVRGKIEWVAPSGNTDIVLSALHSNDKPIASSGGNLAVGSFDFRGQPSTGLYNLDSEADQFRTVEQSAVAGTLHQDFDFARLTSITSYTTTTTRVVADADGTPVPTIVGVLDNEYDAFTQELQLQSSSGSPLQWIVGAFFMRGETSGVFDLGPLTVVSGTRVNSYAAFGQATHAITDDTKITAGLRYTSDDRRLVVSSPFSANISKKDSKPSWRLALDHKFAEDVLGYVSYSRGFKSGVFNATAPDQPAADPTTLDAYEVGVKSEAFDHRLRVNAAVFYYDYKDVQIQLFDGRASYFSNGGSARTYGTDLDVVTEPVRNLTLTGGFSLLDAKFTSQTSAPCFALPNPPSLGGVIRVPGGCILDGRRLAFSPRFVGSLAAKYRHETNIGNFDLTGSFAYNSGYYVDPGNFETTHAKAFDTVNASMTWTAPTGSFSASVWGKNLLDEHRIAGASLGAGIAGTTVYPMPPRTYGVTLGAKF